MNTFVCISGCFITKVLIFEQFSTHRLSDCLQNYCLGIGYLRNEKLLVPSIINRRKTFPKGFKIISVAENEYMLRHFNSELSSNPVHTFFSENLLPTFA